MPLSQIAEVVGATDVFGAAHCHGVSTDTRTLSAGNIYVGLNGPNFKGSQFADAACKAGAAAAVLDKRSDAALPQIVVDDPLLALTRLASAWRAQSQTTVIGITGSNGKTTMRSLVAAAVGNVPTLATQGNLNNHIGVPLTLLRLSAAHRFAVIEMGANHRHEIATLADIAKPAIGIVTNAGPAHLEGFGSLQGVAEGKGELFESLGGAGVAVINRDDDFYSYWCERAKPARCLSFGQHVEADIRCVAVQRVTPVAFTLAYAGAQYSVELQLSGMHNALNACGAIACGIAAGVELDELIDRIATVTPEPGRQRELTSALGGVLIDDSYNANPASMRAAAMALAAAHPHAWMVIGDMGELGEDAQALHASLGPAFREAGIERLFTLGPLSAGTAETFGDGANRFDSVECLIDALASELTADVAVLVKGSRSMRMERVVDALVTAKEVLH
ncbi:MAG: UDP-N-acetylmuramoyl-tripeptide--D-alanyl-D-alanine ligase [Pseudomonadota bacterium]